jgi:hypothetical protein
MLVALHVRLICMFTSNSPCDYDVIKTCQEQQSSICVNNLVIITTCYNMNAIKFLYIGAALIGMQ